MLLVVTPENEVESPEAQRHGENTLIKGEQSAQGTEYRAPLSTLGLGKAQEGSRGERSWTGLRREEGGTESGNGKNTEQNRGLDETAP